MPTWKWVLLVSELALFALILILPQVALPQAAFHGGTAPVLAKLRFSSPWFGAVVAPLASMVLPVLSFDSRADHNIALLAASGNTRLALLCTLIC
jgi:hypothetical protein